MRSALQSDAVKTSVLLSSMVPPVTFVITPSPRSDERILIVTLSPLVALSPEFGSDDKRTVNVVHVSFSSVSPNASVT